MCHWVENVLDEADLRQGCPLSPVLYSVYVMEMLNDLEEIVRNLSGRNMVCWVAVCR